jgi:beta-galactosidase/beta-glucuronidase
MLRSIRTKMRPNKPLVVAGLLCIGAFAHPAFARTSVLIDKGWKFIKQDPAGAQATGFTDASWSSVNLPHSFDIPYFRANSAVPPYVGWYRRHIAIDPATIAGKQRVFLEFEAAFLVSQVYVNGTLVGIHRGGYTGFSYDITSNIQAGDNVVAVRLDANWNDTVAPRSGEHIFIGGIYRDVYLVTTDPLHVPWYGTFVATPQVSTTSGTVKVQTEIKNDGAAAVANCTVKSSILDSSGNVVTTFQSSGSVPAGTLDTFVQTIPAISNPHLWSPSTPYMYKVETEVYNGTSLVDNFESPLGFRSVSWSKDTGFILNGNRFWLQGTNVHQDHAGWGDANSPSASYRDVRMVKEAGMNFIRGSHYPHHPAFVDATDKYGICLWSEAPFWGVYSNATGWESGCYPSDPNITATFDQNVLTQLTEMIRIHRNHPSVVVWSMGNEDWFTTNMAGTVSLLKKMVALVHVIDPTRAAAIGGVQVGDLAQYGDVAGFNGGGATDFINPSYPNMVTEYGSCQESRPGTSDPCWGSLQTTNGKPTQYAWRGGAALWCAFHHGSNLNTGNMGMIDHARLPLRRWYYYRNTLAGVPNPTWSVAGTAAKLQLTTDNDTLTDDGLTDCQLVVQVQNGTGAWLNSTPDITFTDASGLGAFPTGSSITFTGGAEEKGVLDGMAAIEFRSYHAGTITIQATSSGLASASVTLHVKHVSDTLTTGIRAVRAKSPAFVENASFTSFGNRIEIPIAWRGRGVDISVYDLSGKRIYSSKRNVAPESLDIGTKDGVYLVRLHALP